MSLILENILGPNVLVRQSLSRPRKMRFHGFNLIFKAKINAINDRLVPLAEEITEAEDTLVKTVEQYHVDFIKFTEQLRKTDLLKQKHEKLLTGSVAEQKKLRRVFKLMLAKSL